MEITSEVEKNRPGKRTLVSVSEKEGKEEKEREKEGGREEEREDIRMNQSLNHFSRHRANFVGTLICYIMK